MASMAKPTQKRKLQNYWKLASVCKETEDKINFFDLYQEAFELMPESQEELKSARIYFQQEWGIDLEEYEKKNADYPNEFKVIAFNSCILNGVAYSEFKDLYGFYY